jgi:hypothetical protein
LIHTGDIKFIEDHWSLLTLPYGKEFSDTFQIMHQAVQFIAITGKSIFPPRFDDSHTSFGWDYQQKCFAGEWMHFKHTMRLELCPCSLTMRLVTYGESACESFTLNKKTKKEVYAHLRQLLLDGGVKIDHFVTDMHYDLPGHNVCTGGRYTIHKEELNRELCKHYSNAFILLHLLSRKTLNSSKIRCWPHHFDITLSLNLPHGNKDESAAFRMGFSPANFDSAEPHFFLLFKGEPGAKRLKKKLKYSSWLPGGKTGTFLPLSSLTDKKTIKAQTEALVNFMNESIQFMI